MAKQLKKGRVKKDKNYVKESKPVISTDGKKVIWMFDKIDRSGIYAFNTNRANSHDYDLFIKKSAYLSSKI